MRKRWLTYSIRTIILLTLLIGGGYGYLAAQREPYQRQQAAIRLLESAGAELTIESTPGGWRTLAVPRRILVHVTAVQATEREFSDQQAASLRDLIGLKFVMLDSSAITDAGLKHLEGKELSDLQLLGCQITDQSMKMIGKMSGLTTLAIVHADVSSAGVCRLGSLQQLEILILEQTCIDDGAMQMIGRLPRLKRLDVSSTRVSDAGIAALANHDSLELLDIMHTYVTNESAATLLTLPMLNRVYAAGTDLMQDVLDEVKRKHPNRRLIAVGSKRPRDRDFPPLFVRECLTEHAHVTTDKDGKRIRDD